MSDSAGGKKARFVQTTVEVEGRTETRVVEVPAFEPAPWTADTPLSIVGTSPPRVDAFEKVTGRARYTADTVRPGILYAVIVRAPIAKGTLTAIDLDTARAMPGVRGVMGPGDAPAGTRLFRREVSYAGQSLAAVCAESLLDAERAARAIAASLVIAPEPHAVTVDDAIAADAPPVRRTGNTTEPDIVQRGDIARGLAEADVTLTREYRTPVALHSALEPHGAVCEWTGDHLTVWESTQGIFRVRSDVAKALGVPQSRVRVIKDYMGGGFGAKNSAGPHTYTAALFARALGAPVRCINDRRGEQTDSGNRPATVQKVTIAARRDGTLTAIALDALIPLGISGWEGGPAQIFHELYHCPNVRTAETMVYINAGGMQAFRGPGYVEGAFALEGAMNALARALEMDPVALRVKNLATHDERTGRPFSGNRLDECYAEGMKRFGWSSAIDHPPSALSRAKRGRGVAAQTWPTGGGPPSYANVRINSDGSVDVLAGTQDLGTGSRTILAQIAAEALGARLDSVRAVIGDTERLPYTGNSWGSMTTPSVGPAVRMAAEEAKSHLLEAAAQMLEVPVARLGTRDSQVMLDADVALSFSDLCRKLGNVQIVGHGSRGPNPELAVVTVGAQFAEVEVDAETGVVKVLRIVAVHDAGRIINPALAESQLHGGIIQGIGYALFEERHIDRASGATLNANLHDYKVPTMVDIPAIDASFLAGADPAANHVGARGIAEPPIIPTAPAIAAAVADALGVEVCSLPLTPWRVLGALTG
ncbi:MAG: xanthine dehydrogenase family protein molybdopterin-binding subunit [Gemmatimonadetes bacterium]|nr:xanthine dehydrogenase family protein molybdopterin-binding subunit [Gemmatimonadota bacterium]